MEFGPAPPLGVAPSEHLPTSQAAVLTGHEGPVLAVRFNAQGTYCLSCGKVCYRRCAALISLRLPEAANYLILTSLLCASFSVYRIVQLDYGIPIEAYK